MYNNPTYDRFAPADDITVHAAKAVKAVTSSPSPATKPRVTHRYSPRPPAATRPESPPMTPLKATSSD